MAFQDFSVGKKNAVLVIAISIFILLISWIGLQIYLSIYEKEELKNVENRLNLLLHDQIEIKKNVGLTGAVAVASNGQIQQALRSIDNALAYRAVNEIGNNFRAHTDFKNIKIHVHTAGIRSLARGWAPDKHGDDLKGFRHTIGKVKETQKPVVAFEVGLTLFRKRSLPPKSTTSS